MRVPGTFKQLWEQLKSAPTPVTSISIPTKDGPLVLTFASSDKDKPATVAAAKSAPVFPQAPAKRPSDVVGVFATPPEFRDPPLAKLSDLT